ncbi:MAG: choice-of-anchor D domain-containing protein [Acidobacteria bacterium]|nr:choice-of-anchor D domain-containing protein [Acidobacteriota bacterium]
MDKPTIQAAILSAANGDTVLVLPGTYKEHIDFSRKAITVKSVSGPDITIIDGGLQPGVVVSFTQGEGPASVLQGFTIQNGAADEGGGITVQGASPTITGNRIVNNSGCSGAGIGVGFGNPIIQGNTISGNKGNCGGLGGGGIEFRGASTGKVLNNVITGNSTNSDGGGVVLWAGGAVTLRDNIITGNTAGGTGGGIATVNSAPAIIAGNLIAGNKANGAGALSFSNPYGALINNTIAGNQSTNMTSSAVSGLQASFDVNSRTVGNLIIAAAGQIALACGVYGQVPINGTFKNNDVFSVGGGNAYQSSCVTQTGSQGNISADPQFVNAAAGNYRLQSTSPALNGGDAAAAELASTDLDGNSRFRAGKVDMGAYEYPGATSVTVWPAPVNFQQQAVGSSSDVQAVTVTNTGAAPLQIASIATTGDFSQTSTCPTTSSVPSGGNCIVAVTFTPTARGSRAGTLTIVSNAAGSPSVVNLTGTAVGAVLNLSSTAITFPNQLTGTDSPPQQLALTNNGDYPLIVSNITATAEFTQTNTCGSPLPIGGSCTVSVVFHPIASGTRTGTLTINNNAVGGTQTVGMTGNGQALLPTLTSISPTGASTGGATFTLTVQGTNFISNSVVRWNGNDRPTTYTGPTRLTANIPAGDLATGGAFPITVFNPAPGGGSSNAVIITVSNLVPNLTSLSPTSALVGSPGFQLTLNGTNFVSGAEVRWNGNARPTTFVSPNQLRADISAVDISFASTNQLTVFNPSPGGGISASLTFTAVVPTPVPVLTSISPASATAGDPPLTLTLNGSGFGPTSTVRWGAAGRATTYISDTELRAAISAADLAYGGTVFVTVSNPAPGGGISATQVFTIAGSPLPTISSVSPSTITGGLAAATITVTGSGFTSSSVVRWNGADRSTTFVTASRLTASLLAADTAAMGTVKVAVYNPPPGGGTSQTFNVSIAPNPTPTIQSLTPAFLTVGTAPQAVQVRGNGLTSTSVIRWNGQDRATTVVDSSVVSVLLTAADLAVPGLAEVRVFNPPPGGGLSSPMWFSVGIGISASGIVYDRTRDLLWIAVPSSVAKYGNSVVSIDPLTGAVGQPIFVGAEPGKVVIADDGSYLYVALTGAAAVRRVDLAAQKADLQFPLGSDSSFGATYVDDMDVMPGAPHTIAVSRKYIGVSPRHAGVAIYDDGVMRPNTTKVHTGSDRIEFSSLPTTIYGFNNETTEFGFRILTVDANGVKETQNFAGSAIGGFGADMRYNGGRMYATSGAILNPDIGALLGKFSLSGTVSGLAPDQALGRTFFVLSGQNASIAAFDNSTFLSLGSIPIPGLTVNATADDVMVRWGDDGLAVRSPGGVFILRSAMVNPPAISSDNIVNAAGFTAGPVAAGSIATLFGSGLAGRTLGATGTPLPTSLGGIMLTVNSAPAPLYFVSPGQINFQVPWEVAGRPSPDVAVSAPGFVEHSERLKLAQYAPGIFTDGAPNGQAIATVAGTAILAAPAGYAPGTRPAYIGETLTLYCTGMGPVDNTPLTGFPTPADPLARTTAQPSVTIGGRSANVSFSGLAPGLIGVYQINVQVPSGAAAGNAVPISLSIGGVSANSPTIAIQ